MEKRRGISPRKIGSLIGFIIMVVFLAYMIKGIASGGDNGDSKFEPFGYRPVVVVSGSMLPEIAVNSVSIMKYCNMDEIEVGDIVMYRHPSLGINITHRAIEKGIDNGGNTYLVTKGDANEGEDNLKITEDMLVGELITTYNETAPYISFVMLENGEVNTIALLQIIILVAVIITIVGMVVYFLWVILTSIFMVLFGKRNIDKVVSNYKYNISIQQDNLDIVNNLHFKKGDSLRVIIAKVIVARELRAAEETIHDMEKAYKIARKIGGKQFSGGDIDRDDK